MSARTQTQRVVTLLLVLAFLICSVPVFAVPASAADSETYLYNGVELASHKVDTYSDNYPYCTILYYGYQSTYYLIVSNYQYYFDGEYLCQQSIESRAAYVYTSSTGLLWSYKQYSNGGYFFNYHLSDEISSINLELIWSNYDFLNDDGSVYLSASEPLRNNAVTELKIECASWVGAGQWIPITGTVSGTGDYSTACTCTVSGGTSSGTYVTETEAGDNVYNLHVGEDETAESLTVTMTSVQDTSISASKTITVLYPDSGGSEGEDTTPTESTPEDIEATEPTTEDEQGAAENQGNSSIDELTGVIPDYSEGFMDALSGFTSAMTYTGTDAKLTVPAVMFPELGGLVPGFQMMDETVLDFGAYVSMMPQNLMLLVQSLLTIALIVYCFKELYGTISYVLTLKGGSA